MIEPVPTFQSFDLEQLQQIRRLVDQEIQSKQPKSEKILIQTDLEHSHEGYKRKDGRSIIYERRTPVELCLARFNYTVPHERKQGMKSLKSDAFFTSIEYGEAISKAWNYLANNKNATKKLNQAQIDQIFGSFK